MDSAGVLFMKFVGVTVCGTAIGVALYWCFNREPWPFSDRIGTGLGGAAIGAMCSGAPF